MELVCDACGKRYRVASERLAGRKIRLKCRRCGDVIEARAPAAVIEMDRWHVAIDGASVGPLRRHAIAERIAEGRVGGASLVWREGFDGWRPLRDVPELASLLRRPPATPRSPRPTPRTGGPRLTGPRLAGPRPTGPRPTGPLLAGPRATGPSVAVPHPPRPLSPLAATSPSAQRPIARMAVNGGPFPGPAPAEATAQPEPTRSPLPAYVPSNRPRLPRPAVDAAPVELELEIPAEPAPAAAQPTEPPLRAADATPARTVPLGFWLALVGVVCFAVTVGVVVGLRIPLEASTNNPPAAAPVERAEELPAVVVDVPIVHDAAETAAPTAEPDDDIALPAVEIQRPRRSPAPVADADDVVPPIDAVDPADPTFDGLDIPDLDAVDRTPSRTAVTDRDLMAVVNRRKPQLRQCYDRLIRGMGTPPTVRVRITPHIRSSGRVRSVDVDGGSALPGLSACVERSVASWAFPAPGEPVDAPFTVVFGVGG